MTTTQKSTFKYGTILFTSDGLLGEIERCILGIGAELQLAEVDNDQIEAAFHEEKLDELKTELAKLMKACPQKETLKTYLRERTTHYRQERAKKETPEETKQDDLYQELATIEASKVLTFKVEKEK